MATVHPSRMGLVPQGSSDPHSSRAAPPAHDSRARSRSGERRRDSRSDRHDDDRHNERSRRRERSRERSPRPVRRGSPEYSEYRRPEARDMPPPPVPGQGQGDQAPWRKQENMYPQRREPLRSYGGEGGDYFESNVSTAP
ncbi:hypothetical protein FA95DRAFT_367026 [Auriscalpium vulgare]|uniref:Uncharacterized protein n=1 Tax=Auriscalpium vulgare TaxID=40419 RepID=A0ACB8RHK7_9AGAM|nr:hypothetical protein FA95DRAFT_367026 [Auriscalpium vulgare]